jgi:hypothetical protein
MMKRFALVGLVLALLLPFDVSAQKGGEDKIIHIFVFASQIAPEPDLIRNQSQGAVSHSRMAKEFIT